MNRVPHLIAIIAGVVIGASGASGELWFSDDFESGTLDKWTIGGEQGGLVNVADVVERHGTHMGHLYHEGASTLTLEQMFIYDPALVFEFDLEAHASSEGGPDSSVHASANVTFWFLDELGESLGFVRYLRCTSSYPFDLHNPDPSKEVLPIIDDALHSYSFTIPELLAHIALEPDDPIASIWFRFGEYGTGNSYSNIAELWVDNVAVFLPEPPMQQYAIIELGTFGGAESEAIGINNAGQVVGRAHDQQDDNRPFLYENGVMTDLGTFGGATGSAWGINELGDAVGQAATVSAVRAFLYREDVMMNIDTLGGILSAARGINDDGTVVGLWDVAGGRRRAFAYEDSVMTNLGTLGGSDSAAWAINNNGDIVGYTEVPGNLRRAFLYTGGVMNDLGDLGGAESAALDVNDAGQVVGYSDTAGGEGHGFLLEKGVMTDLGTFGGSVSQAIGINAGGQIVGWAHNSDGEQRAYLWENGVMSDLNDLIPPGSGWVLPNAWDINDVGQIVGWGYFNGTKRAYLMTPSGIADCNDNGVPDDLDIAAGTSLDCQPNAIPDECEVGPGHDCCEIGHRIGCSDPAIEACVCAIDPYCCETDWDRVCIAIVTSDGCGTCDAHLDCNANGVPDDCDIADGASDDCNANSVPDECEDGVCTCLLRGDVDRNEKIGKADLHAMADLLQSGVFADEDYCTADLDDDGDIDFDDLHLLIDLVFEGTGTRSFGGTGVVPGPL